VLSNKHTQNNIWIRKLVEVNNNPVVTNLIFFFKIKNWREQILRFNAYIYWLSLFNVVNEEIQSCFHFTSMLLSLKQYTWSGCVRDNIIYGGIFLGLEGSTYPLSSGSNLYCHKLVITVSIMCRYTEICCTVWDSSFEWSSWHLFFCTCNARKLFSVYFLYIFDFIIKITESLYSILFNLYQEQKKLRSNNIITQFIVISLSTEQSLPLAHFVCAEF